MSVDYEEMLKQDAFSALTNEQKRAYVTLGENLKGKNTGESAVIIMNFIKTMPKGKTLSKEEQTAMFSVMLESLDEAEAKKFYGLMKMFNLG